MQHSRPCYGSFAWFHRWSHMSRMCTIAPAMWVLVVAGACHMDAPYQWRLVTGAGGARLVRDDSSRSLQRYSSFLPMIRCSGSIHGAVPAAVAPPEWNPASAAPSQRSLILEDAMTLAKHCAEAEELPVLAGQAGQGPADASTPTLPRLAGVRGLPDRGTLEEVWQATHRTGS
jgi:hypothetical protein